jgi:mRNA-degrading endonuclease RelE of RelBE toxin-antitoxin system
MKKLRPNPVAQRQLRLFGRYRILFNVDRAKRRVTIVLVGEKRRDALIVQGRRFTTHHESDPTE